MKTIFGLSILCLILLTACTPATAEPVSGTGEAPPTIHPLLAPQTPITVFSGTPRPTTEPTREETATPPEEIIPAPQQVVTLTLFDEKLNANWMLSGTALRDDGATTVSHSGDTSLALTGEDGRYEIFQVRSSSQVRLSRSQVLGLSFWLYTGEQELNIDQLLVEIFGSDEVHYWVKGDDSALIGLKTFTGRRLYGLGLNRALEPETWIQIEILLENLVYDPNFDEKPVEDFPFEYVTGFSILFAGGFSGTVYLDEVQIFTVAE